MAEQTMKDARVVFQKYDVEEKGFINFIDLCSLFTDLGMWERYRHNFDIFMDSIMERYDKNLDGVISFEEFVTIHNELVDFEKSE